MDKTGGWGLKEDGGKQKKKKKRNGLILSKPPKQIRTEHAVWPDKQKHEKEQSLRYLDSYRNINLN